MNYNFYGSIYSWLPVVLPLVVPAADNQQHIALMHKLILITIMAVSVLTQYISS